jgi:hypothetical protein
MYAMAMAVCGVVSALPKTNNALFLLRQKLRRLHPACPRTVQTETARLRTDRISDGFLPWFCCSMAPYASMLDTAGVSFARAQPFPPQPLFATD